MKKVLLMFGLFIFLMATSTSFADTFGGGTFYQFTLNFVPVGDANNSEYGSAYGYGGVGYDYRIGKTEITAEQWLSLERALSGVNYATGTNLPRQATLMDAAGYCNWLHNGATNDANTLYTGVYQIVNNVFVAWDINDQWINTDGTRNPYRHKNAKYFLPNIDEFYKAGWYKGGNLNATYWSYPNQSNTVPVAEGPSAGTNSANWNAGTDLGALAVGSYPNSVGPYGTLDMGGNVWEFVDPNDAGFSGGNCYPTIIGGGHPHGSSWLTGQPLAGAIGANDRYDWVGFRIAASKLSHGTQWVRSNDFTIMAAVGTSANFSQAMLNSPVYRDLNTTTFLPWTYLSPYEFLEHNELVYLPWHQLIPTDANYTDGVTDATKALTATLCGRFSDNTGFVIGDEPARLQMTTTAAAQNYYRQTYPDTLVYTNLNPHGQPDIRYYDGTYDGTPPPGGYDYYAYLDDYMNIVTPDLLIFDSYPFLLNGTTVSHYFLNMAIIRQYALDAKIPYWSWMQAYGDGSYYRMPSGSDIWMHVFSHLTYGYTGISYFTYNNLVGTAAMVQDGWQNTPNQIYIDAANANNRVRHLGDTLKCLQSTDVRYVLGTGNSLPDGTTQWAAGAGGDSHITNISINSTGAERNALIGFFTDDAGQQYFMFTNLRHSASLSPGEASLQFTITFDSTINTILLLSSDTSEPLVLTLTNHAYTWDLAGGDGNLFKYNTGTFVCLPGPGLAWNPTPTNSATNISLSTELNWSAGYGAASHEVYFGTSQTTVADANHSSAEYKGNQTGTTYAPGTLTNKTTYYWRIDEVGTGGTTKGTVWSFTTIAAVPTFVSAGSITSGTGTITPALPAGITTGDILLLFIETSNQAVSISNQNGGTWTQVTNSPQYTGTAAGTTGVRLAAYWSRYNGTQGNPTVSDSGNHQMGRIIAIRGAVSSGNPWDITAGGVEAASDTSGSIPGATTTVGNTLVVAVVAASLPDATGTANFSSWANSNLTSITERTDNTVTAGNGGGLGVATGIKATAGAYGNTTVTLASSAYKGMMSIAIKP